MQSLALSWLVYRLTHSALLMGTVGFCTQIPVLLLSPAGGLAADRFPRRAVVILMQALMAAQAVTLAALTYTGRIGVGQIVVLALAGGALSAFEIPARQSMYVHMVGKEDLPNAIALNSMTFNAARVVGPSMGGFLVAALGEALCFALNAVSFAAVIVAFARMGTVQRPPAAHGSPLDHLREGFRYAWTNRTVRGLLLLTALTNFATAPASVLAPVFADAIFGRGSQGLGLLSGCFGVGAVVGTVVLAGRTRTAGLARVIWISALGVAGGLALYSAAPFYPVLLVAIALCGFSIMRQLASTNSAIQSVIGDEYRGRIMALYSMTVIGVLPLGNLAAGAVAHAVGPRAAVFLGAAAVLAAALNFRRHRAAVEEALS
jgi:MFS family permease